MFSLNSLNVVTPLMVHQLNGNFCGGGTTVILLHVGWPGTLSVRRILRLCLSGSMYCISSN